MQAVSGLKAEFGQLEVEWKGEVQGAKAQAQALQNQLAAVQARMSELAGRLLSEISKAAQLRQCNVTQAEVSSYFRASQSLCLGICKCVASQFWMYTQPPMPFHQVLHFSCWTCLRSRHTVVAGEDKC